MLSKYKLTISLKDAAEAISNVSSQFSGSRYGNLRNYRSALVNYAVFWGNLFDRFKFLKLFFFGQSTLILPSCYGRPVMKVVKLLYLPKGIKADFRAFGVLRGCIIIIVNCFQYSL